MAGEPIFGRKQTAGMQAMGEPGRAIGLSAEAEAFRASLRTGRGDATSSFADWRRQQQPRRVLVWALRLALISPGLLCFLIQAPLEASVGLEVAGVLSNVWIRRERQRHLRAIASWDPEA